MIVAPVILSIQVGKPLVLGISGSSDPLLKPWRSAIHKHPVHGPVRARRVGLDGDGQADRRHHGGFDKAILAYAAAHYPSWRAELGKDEAEFGFGAFGENLTVQGLDEDSVCIGDQFEVGGGVRIEVSQPRQPCLNLSRRWLRPGLMERVKESGRTGWYLRVLREGDLVAGMPIKLSERPHPEWSIARASLVMLHRGQHRTDTELLAGLPELSISWRESLLNG